MYFMQEKQNKNNYIAPALPVKLALNQQSKPTEILTTLTLLIAPLSSLSN